MISEVKSYLGSRTVVRARGGETSSIVVLGIGDSAIVISASCIPQSRLEQLKACSEERDTGG